MLLFQHKGGDQDISNYAGQTCAFSKHLYSPMLKMTPRYCFNSNFRSNVNFKIKTKI